MTSLTYCHNRHFYYLIEKENLPITGLDRSLRLQKVEAPRISR
jgi:hypothetical protein